MPPEGRCAVALDFEEEDGRHTFNKLDQVLAYEKVAREEGWTGTGPFVDFRSVCVVNWECDLLLF